MTDLKISAADARHILVAIDKLPPEAYGGDTIFYRYCADPEAFDAKIRKLRPEDYRAGEKKWRTIWAWC